MNLNNKPNIAEYVSSISYRELEIKKEKRKRLQLYTTMDSLLNLNTFLDFYSYDLIKVLKESKSLRNLLEKNNPEKIVKDEDLLFSFLLTESNLQKILNEYGITKEKILKFFPKLVIKEETKIFSFLPKQVLNNKQETVEFSDNILFLIEKSIENAYERFKTPVITSEIFFITLMEAKDLKIAKILKKLLIDEVNWYTLRYKLIKCIRFEESHIRNDVLKNRKLFVYLLKTQLSDLDFCKLIDRHVLDSAVLYFRTELISQSLKVPFFKQIEKDIYYSAKTNKRKYSQ